MTTTADGRPIQLTRDDDARRYRASIGGGPVATAEFLLTTELIVFTHTEVDPALEGQGVGSALVRWALDDARERGYHVVASCPFVRAYVERHSEEYADLLYTSPGRQPS